MTWRNPSLGRSALLDAAFERATLYRTRLKRLKEINQPATATGTNALRAISISALTPLSVADKFKELMAQKPVAGFLLSNAVGERRSASFHRGLALNRQSHCCYPAPLITAARRYRVPRNLPQTNQPGSARQLAAML